MGICSRSTAGASTTPRRGMSLGAAGAGPGSLSCCGLSDGWALGACRLPRGCGPLRGRAGTGGGAGVPGECPRRCGRTSLPPEGALDGGRSTRRGTFPGALCTSGARCALRRRSGRPALGPWHLHARVSRLRQADGDGLLGRSRTMLPLADVVYLLSNELARLSGRRFSFTPVASCAGNCFFLGHLSLPCCRRGRRPSTPLTRSAYHHAVVVPASTR
jgi:hypothetical protein